MTPESPATWPVSFWLLPAASDAQWLQALVDSLAQQHGAPPFEPHITLHAAACPRDADLHLQAVMDETARSCNALSLTALATGESAAYFKTLFVNFPVDGQDGERLVELRRRLVTALVAGSGERETAQGPSTTSLPIERETAADSFEREMAAYSFLPHLSLLYADVSPSLRSALAQQNNHQGRRFAFDRIAAVRPASGHADLSQVANWEVFARRTLRD
jgi:2'-5' RNA ligase